MKTRKNIFLSITTAGCAALTSVLASFTNMEETTCKSTKVDFSGITYINQSDGRVVNLETTDDSRVYDIANFSVCGDTLVIRSRNNLHTFSSTGKHIACILQEKKVVKTRGIISNVFFENQTVAVHDFNQKTVSWYNLKGEPLSSMKYKIAGEDVFPVHIYPWNGGYIATNAYGGESVDRKTLCFVNKELNTGIAIEGRSLTSGRGISDDISIDEQGNVLYHEQLCDTLFTVRDGMLTPLLAIDFGTHALPEDVARQDIYEREDYVTRLYKEGKPLAGWPSFFQRIGNIIYFTCVSPDNGIVLCRYDEKEGTTRLFAVDFDNPQYMTQLPFFIRDNVAYWQVRDKNNASQNPLLFVFPLDCL